MIMSVFTPAGVLILTLLGKNLNLTAIYVVVAIMGFTYNARSSITYVFGSEFTPKAYNMRYSMAIFVTSGLLQALSGWFFWQFRSQEIYCYILVGLQLPAMAWIAFKAPESPHYLLEKFDYENLRLCLIKVAKVNGVEEQIDFDHMIKKLKIGAEKELQELKDEAAEAKKANVVQVQGEGN